MLWCRGGSEVVESVGWGGFGVVGIGLERGLGWGLLWCYGWGTLSLWLLGGEWDLGWGLLWCYGWLSSPHGFGADVVVGIGLGGDLGWGLLWCYGWGTPLPDPHVGLGAAAAPEVGGGHFLGVSGAV